MDGYIFDYRLGYVRAGCAMQGFDVIGTGGATKRIVALGGYTTPEMANANCSWAHALHARLGGGVQILNGCTDGYSSAQILTMFIRDGILLNPYKVVCLSGFYNMAYKLGLVREKADAELLSTHPFATPRQMAFLRDITSRFGLGKDEVYYGEENDLPAWELWLRQMAEIKCLCDEFGIIFKSFLQPCVFSGGYQRSERENKYLREHYALTEDELERFHTRFQREYTQIQTRVGETGYITDLSGVFDGCSNVYASACHIKDEYMARLTEAMV